MVARGQLKDDMQAPMHSVAQELEKDPGRTKDAYPRVCMQCLPEAQAVRICGDLLNRKSVDDQRPRAPMMHCKTSNRA